jgi:hypothetical protein
LAVETPSALYDPRSRRLLQKSGYKNPQLKTLLDQGHSLTAFQSMYSPEEFTILTGDGRVPNLRTFPEPLMLLASTLYSLSIQEVVDGEETSVSSE